MRVEVQNELAEVIREFGPELYDDFDAVCDCPMSCLCSHLTFLEPYHGSVCKRPAVLRSAWYLETEEWDGRYRRSGKSPRASDGQFELVPTVISH